MEINVSWFIILKLYSQKNDPNEFLMSDIKHFG